MLKVLGQFKSIILEVYGKEDNTKLVKRYGVETGDNLMEMYKTFINRKGKNWQSMFRVYFDADIEVVESLRKMGINVRENKTPKSVIEYWGGNKENYPYVFNNVYWFWKLVEYGYRMGINKNIQFGLYQMRKYLRISRQSDIKMYNINNVESENVIYEAKLFAA